MLYLVKYPILVSPLGHELHSQFYFFFHIIPHRFHNPSIFSYISLSILHSLSFYSINYSLINISCQLTLFIWRSWHHGFFLHTSPSIYYFFPCRIIDSIKTTFEKSSSLKTKLWVAHESNQDQSTEIVATSIPLDLERKINQKATFKIPTDPRINSDKFIRKCFPKRICQRNLRMPSEELIDHDMFGKVFFSTDFRNFVFALKL